MRVKYYAGSAAATRHLIDLGHTDIAYIGVDPTKGSTTTGYPGHREVDEQRMCGFTETMQGCQLLVKQNLIRICHNYGAVGDIAAAPAEAYEAARSLLAERPRPTAIFATYDIFAAGVLQAIYEAGLRVPADISVIGFDNTYAPYLAPQIDHRGPADARHRPHRGAHCGANLAGRGAAAFAAHGNAVDASGGAGVDRAVAALSGRFFRAESAPALPGRCLPSVCKRFHKVCKKGDRHRRAESRIA